MRRASAAAAELLGFGKNEPSFEVMEELNKAREDLMEKSEIIEQLNTEQVVTRRLLLELQHLINGQQATIGKIFSKDT